MVRNVVNIPAEWMTSSKCRLLWVEPCGTGSCHSAVMRCKVGLRTKNLYIEIHRLDLWGFFFRHSVNEQLQHAHSTIIWQCWWKRKLKNALIVRSRQVLHRRYKQNFLVHWIKSFFFFREVPDLSPARRQAILPFAWFYSATSCKFRYSTLSKTQPLPLISLPFVIHV